MQIDIENGRRFNEEPAISAVSSGADIVLVRLADGTGVKALPLSALTSRPVTSQPWRPKTRPAWSLRSTSCWLTSARTGSASTAWMI